MKVNNDSNYIKLEKIIFSINCQYCLNSLFSFSQYNFAKLLVVLHFDQFSIDSPVLDILLLCVVEH